MTFGQFAQKAKRLMGPTDEDHETRYIVFKEPGFATVILTQLGPASEYNIELTFEDYKLTQVCAFDELGPEPVNVPLFLEILRLLESNGGITA